MLEGWLVAGFIALLAVMPLLLGVTGQRPWPMLLARSWVLVLFAGFMALTWRMREPVRASGLWLVLLGVFGFTLLQVIPLPPGLVALLSPAAAGLFHMSLDSLGQYGTGQWRPLSLDPAETWQALSGLAGLLMVYLFAANLLSHDKNLERFLRAVAIIGACVAMLGFVQKAFDADRILWLVPFSRDVPFFFSTFVNPNHLAAFLGFAVPLQISLALKSPERQGKWLYLIMALVSASAIFMTLSRGGIVAFLAGQLLLAYLLLRRRQAKLDVLWIQALVVGVLAVASLLAMHELTQKFGALSSPSEHLVKEARAGLWEDSLHMAASYPLTGIGAEAFKVAYPVYKTTRPDQRFTHPENILLQLATESGLPVTALLVTGLLLTLWLIYRQRHLKRYEAGAFCAVVAVGLHNYMDFNLSSYAVAVPFVALLAVLEMRALEQTRSRRFRPLPLSRRTLLAFWVLASLGLAIGLGIWLEHRLPRAQARVHAVAYGEDIPDARFDAVLGRALAWHPADYYLRLLASERYETGSFGDLPLKIHHLDKAARLNPTGSTIPLLTGRAWAAVKDKDRARDAFALVAARTEPHRSLEPLWLEMRRGSFTAAELAALCPPENERVFELARFLLDQGMASGASAFLRDWLSAPQRRSADGLYLLGLIALEEGRFDEAAATGTALAAEFPEHHEGYLLTGLTFARQHEHQTALDWYRKADRVSPYNLDVWFVLARSLVYLGRLEEAEELGDRIHAISWNHHQKRLNAFLLSGDIDMAQGKFRHAQLEYERALTYAPRHGGIHFKLALAAEKRGDPITALRHYRLARRHGHASGELDGAILRMREAVERLKGKRP